MPHKRANEGLDKTADRARSGGRFRMKPQDFQCLPLRPLMGHSWWQCECCVCQEDSTMYNCSPSSPKTVNQQNQKQCCGEGIETVPAPVGWFYLHGGTHQVIPCIKRGKGRLSVGDLCNKWKYIIQTKQSTENVLHDVNAQYEWVGYIGKYITCSPDLDDWTKIMQAIVITYFASFSHETITLPRRS